MWGMRWSQDEAAFEAAAAAAELDSKRRRVQAAEMTWLAVSVYSCARLRYMRAADHCHYHHPHCRTG